MQVFDCQHCHQPFQVSAEYAGKPVQCPSCAKPNLIPASGGQSGANTNLLFACPSCSGQFQVPLSMNEQTVGCPHCSTPVLVQADSSKQSGSDDTPAINTKIKRRGSKSKAKGHRGEKFVKPPQDLFAPGFKDKPVVAEPLDPSAKQPAASKPAAPKPSTKKPGTATPDAEERSVKKTPVASKPQTQTGDAKRAAKKPPAKQARVADGAAKKKLPTPGVAAGAKEAKTTTSKKVATQKSTPSKTDSQPPARSAKPQHPVEPQGTIPSRRSKSDVGKQPVPPAKSASKNVIQPNAAKNVGAKEPAEKKETPKSKAIEKTRQADQAVAGGSKTKTETAKTTKAGGKKTATSKQDASSKPPASGKPAKKSSGANGVKAVKTPVASDAKVEFVEDTAKKPVDVVTATVAPSSDVDDVIEAVVASSPSVPSTPVSAAANVTAASHQVSGDIAVVADMGRSVESIAHLLPPTFDVYDPERLNVTVSRDDNKVILPGADGGTTRIDKRIVHVDHGGEKVSLVVLSPEQRERRRMIQNLIVIGIGVALIAATIWMLIN